MHPELLRALARARHHDLLDDVVLEASRESGAVTIVRGCLVRAGEWARLLIWAGARLLGEERAALDLAHE